MSCSLYEARENREKTLMVVPSPSIVDVDVVSGSGVCAVMVDFCIMLDRGKRAGERKKEKIDMGNLHFSETS